MCSPLLLTTHHFETVLGSIVVIHPHDSLLQLLDFHGADEEDLEADLGGSELLKVEARHAILELPALDHCRRSVPSCGYQE